MVKLKCNYCNNKIKIYKKFYKCINCNKVFKVSNNIFLGLDENFQNNIKNWQDELADNYLEVSAKTVGYRSSTQQNKIINAFFSAFKGIPDGPTLDIGCGHGGCSNHVVSSQTCGRAALRNIPAYAGSSRDQPLNSR